MQQVGNVIVIGSGFAGLSAASFLARAGFNVTVIEKNATPGGRARQLHAGGYHFDMGPSWYWMPDVFERWFAQFGKKPGDYYQLERLDPSYRVYWKEGYTDLPANLDSLKQVFESIETGAASKLDKFLNEAAYKYKTGIQKLVFKPGNSVTEFLDWDVISGVFRLDIFTSIKKHIHKYFKDPRIRQLLEFPVLFLGALPENTPALYSLMNYADIVGGTWYPRGGMYSVVNAMHQLAMELGVQFKFDETVNSFQFESNKIVNVVTDKGVYPADSVVNGADYQFGESKLLPTALQSYNSDYWNKKVMAPSCLLYYVGIRKKLKQAIHHMLFFDTSFEMHANEIYKQAAWPSDPMFYVSASSITDPAAAPAGCENLVFLIPVAAGLIGDTEELRKEYFRKIVKRFEEHTGETINDSIEFFQTFSIIDFKEQYNSFKGNAYGLANTLTQTAVFRPSCKSKKVKNLFYTGQLTVPGPGVPPSLISGEVVAKELIKNFRN